MTSPVDTPGTPSRSIRGALGFSRAGPVSADLSAGRPSSRSNSVRSVALRRRYNRSFVESQRWRQEKLTTLRDVIRDSRVEVMTGRLRDLERTQVDGGDPGQDSGEDHKRHAQYDHVTRVQWDAKDAMTKVLEARDMRDRRSLLEYAAFEGSGDHVLELARWMRWKVILDTMGLGGLMHQVQANDQNGHTILMYAAKNADLKTFTLCLDLVRDLLGKDGSTEYDRQLTKATLGVGSLTPNEAKTKGTASLLMYAARYAKVEVFVESFDLVEKLLEKNGEANLKQYCKAEDSERKTLVHYAAEARDDGMLDEVKSKLEILDLWDSLKKGVDTQGRTPSMCLLGRRGRSSEVMANAGAPGNSKEEEKNTETMADGTTPMTRMGNNLKILLSGGCNRAQLQTCSAGASKGLSGIMHAARGGSEAFDLACRLIKETDGARSAPLDLVAILGVGSTQDERVEYEMRCAGLIAQAALGGDEEVLNKIGNAIRSTSYSPVKDELNMWANKTDYPMTSSDLFHATRQVRLLGVDHGYKLTESRDMEDSVYSGENCDLKASLLTLTVLSGNKDAVNWAANFGRRSNTPSEGPEGVWTKDTVSPLAYATWTSCTPELFEEVCGALAKDGTTKGETFFRDHIMGLGSRHGLTPLAGALFRGDTHLVEAVITKCGREPLTRDEIVNQIKGKLVRNEEASEENDENLDKIQRILRHSELSITNDVDAVLKKMLQHDGGVSSKGILSTPAISFNEEAQEAHPDAAVARAKKASEGGMYDGLSALIEKGWDCLEYLPEILSRIGHHEAGVISTVLCTVENARTTRQRGISNPFVVGAIASSRMAAARKKRREDAHRLGRLQREIDTFTIEVGRT